MSNDYEEFVKYVYHEHIERRLDRHIRHWIDLEDIKLQRQQTLKVYAGDTVY